jgi:hypothetical protein
MHNLIKGESNMKKILGLSIAILVLGGCAMQDPRLRRNPGLGQAPNPAASQTSASIPTMAPPQDTFLFAGKTRDQLFVAARMALEECGYKIKTGDKESGLFLASKGEARADGTQPPMVTVLVFTDPQGTAGVRIQSLQPNQANDLYGAARSTTDTILAAIQNILR